jgi:hypothetical protein
VPAVPSHHSQGGQGGDVAQVKVLQCFSRPEFARDVFSVISQLGPWSRNLDGSKKECFAATVERCNETRSVSEKDLKDLQDKAARELNKKVCQLTEADVTAFKARELPAHLQHFQHVTLGEGDFDLLLMHASYGLLAGVIQAVEGSNLEVARDVDKAIKQLDKSDAMLQNVTSDISPAPRITKTLMLPNVSQGQLQDVLEHNTTLATVS